MKSGFLMIDKAPDWTSFDVCARLRRAVGVKRIGHTGTLDPFATGLLVVAVGKCTKLIPFLEKDRKTYETEIWLGKTSETLDPESEIIQVPLEKGGNGRGDFKKEDIQSVLDTQFCGNISQIPPKYSALKIGGEKMCDLVRAGKVFEVKPRETEVFSTQVLDFNREKKRVRIRLEVAAGFYVRSFARDLAKALGTVGMCGALRRTGVGRFDITDRVLSKRVFKMSALESMGDMADYFFDPKDILSISTLEIKKERLDDFSHGRAFLCEDPIFLAAVEETKFLMLLEGRAVGVGEKRFKNLQPRTGL